jgi:hypothetical protein
MELQFEGRSASMGNGKKILYRLALAMALVLGISDLAQAKFKRHYPPEEKGPYNVGIRTIDNVPMSSGRLARVQLFYPTLAPANCDTVYTIQGVGGTFERSSPLCAVQDAAPAAGKFPLVVFDHGGGGPGVDAQRISQLPVHELMASHGLIVILQRHSASNVARVFDISLLLDFALSSGNPVSTSIDSKHIGLSGFSAGGRAALTTAAGWAEQGIAPDTRFKAMVLYEPSRENNLDEIADISIPYLIMGGTRMVSGSTTVPEIFNATTDSLRFYVKSPDAVHFHYQSDLCVAIDETREIALSLDPNQDEPLTNMLTPTSPTCDIDPNTGVCRRICNPAMSAPAIQACTYWNQGELLINLVGRAFGGGRNVCDQIGTSADSLRSLDTHPADGYTDEFLGGNPLVALFEPNDVWNSDGATTAEPPTYDEMMPVMENYTVAFFKLFLDGELAYLPYLTRVYAYLRHFPAIVDIRL